MYSSISLKVCSVLFVSEGKESSDYSVIYPLKYPLISSTINRVLEICAAYEYILSRFYLV